MTIDDFILKAQSIDISAIINRAIKKNERSIIELNTRDQLYDRGISSTGDRITPDYSPRTIRRKGYSRVTLHDTGRWHEHFRIDYNSGSIEIYALPEILIRSFDLTSHLKDRYGKEVLGLTSDSIDKMQRIIMPDIISEIKAIWE